MIYLKINYCVNIIMENESIQNHELSSMLERAGIRPSPARILTLKVLSNASKPMSSLEIERQADTLDRSSITRTLSILADEHIIDSIADGSGSMRYELSRGSLHDSHSGDHAHFHCKICGETVCLKDVALPMTRIEEGYVAESITMVITGVCPKCNK